VFLSYKRRIVSANSKISLEQKITTEKKAIKLVMLGDFIMAVFGLVFFYLTRSQAILMDAVYPFVDMVAGLLTLRVVSLMAKQAHQSQPFGYAIFEPVMNFIKGILILLVILVGLYASIKAIILGGHHIEADIAVFYSVLATVINFALAYVLYRMNQTAQSSMIAVDLQGWIVGGILSVAVGLSFLAVIWMESAGYDEWVPYMDPFLLLALIIMMLPMPLKILKENGLQIIGRSDNAEHLAELQQRTSDVFADVPVVDIKLRALQEGRMIYVQAYIQLQPQAAFDLNQQDDYRNRLYQQLKQTNDYLSLDVIYTAQPIWVARSDGEASD